MTPPSINAQGDITIAATLEGDGVDNTNSGGIWKTSNGELQLVLRDGDEAPGIDGAVFRSLSRELFNSGEIYTPDINAQGDIAFPTRIDFPDTGSDGLGVDGIWKTVNGVPQVVVRTQEQAPGLNGQTFGSFTRRTLPTINARGDVAFYSQLFILQTTFEERFGIWSTSDGILRSIVQPDDTIPGFGEIREVPNPLLPQAPILNVAGDMMFPINQGGFSFGTTAVYSGHLDEFFILPSISFDFAPHDGSSPINDAGQIVYRGDSGIYVAKLPSPCNPADLFPPFGLLNADDVLQFVNAFNSDDLRMADIFPAPAEPFINPLAGDGLLNADDVLSFVNAFNAGCP